MALRKSSNVMLRLATQQIESNGTRYAFPRPQASSKGGPSQRSYSTG
jgi:hypothetical protein